MKDPQRRLESPRETIIWSAQCQEHFLPWGVRSGDTKRTKLIVEAGISDLYPGYLLARHSPNYHLMVYTTHGEGELETKGRKARIKRDHLLLIPANQGFTYAPHEGRWRFLWFHLPPGGAWSSLEGQESRIQRTVLRQPLEDATEGYLRECRNESPYSEEATALYAELIGLYIERELGSPTGAQLGENNARLQKLWEEVSPNLSTNWTIEKLAHLAAASPSHLHRLCRQQYGMSPMKIVQRLRMERAQELLVLYGYPVSRIAHMVGYTNEFAFSVSFKKYSGDTPTDFRKRL